MRELVCIRTYLNRMEAEAIKNFLEANRIMATLVTDDAGGMEPGLTMSNGIKVLVEIKDEETALDLIKKANGKAVGCAGH